MKGTFLVRLAIMLLVVLPVLVLAVFVAFWSYPGEDMPDMNLLINSLLLVLLGPSVLALILVWIHAPLTRRVERQLPLGRTAASAVVGAGLGFALGLLWSLAVYWGIGVGLQGLGAGLLYGILVSWIGGGSLIGECRID